MPEITYRETLTVVTCTCGINFAIPDALNRQLLDHPSGSGANTKSVYCPLGHRWHYLGKSPEQKLADERKRTQAVRDLLAAEERSHSATKGQLTKVKKRVAHGVCPCCHRTFANVARHMAAKHPDQVTA